MTERVSRSHRMMAFVALQIAFFVFASLSEGAEYHLDEGESGTLVFESITRIAVGNQQILDAAPLSQHQILLTGKKTGLSTLLVWDSKGQHKNTVIVHESRGASQWELDAAIDAKSVRASVRGKGVILEGVVETTKERKRAEAIASLFGEKVVNLIEVRNAQQIQLETTLMELNTQAAQKLGFRSLSWKRNEVGEMTFGMSPTTGSYALWDDAVGVSKAVAMTFDALIQNNEARILSRPYLVTLSGEEASINVGGEIPVPVGIENNQIKIEWKPYGVILRITPEIDALNQIWLTLFAEVSEIDWDNAIEASNIKIPALRTRKISNKTRVNPGQTLVIGGLIDNKQTKLLSKIPLLGDIPILGELFRSKSFQNSQTELVVTVIPQVVGRK